MARTPLRIQLLGLAAILFLLAPPPSVRGDDPKTEDARLKVLRARVATWLEAKKTFYVSCSACDGRGTAVKQTPSGALTYTCPRCHGLKTRVNRPSFYLLSYDLMTPAWQQQKGARTQMEAVADLLDEGKGRPAKVSSGVLARTELVGARYAIAYVRLNDEDREQRVQWVWALPAGAKKETWFLFGGEVDGAWAQEGCATEPVGRRPLEAKEAEDLKAALEGLALRHSVTAKEAAGDLLLISLSIEGAHTPDDLKAAVRDDAIAVTRASLGKLKDWSAVRLQFSADWLDKFGRAASKPHMLVCLGRGEYEKIVFENLKPDQVFGLFSTAPQTYPDMTLRTP